MILKSIFFKKKGKSDERFLETCEELNNGSPLHDLSLDFIDFMGFLKPVEFYHKAFVRRKLFTITFIFLNLILILLWETFIEFHGIGISSLLASSFEDSQKGFSLIFVFKGFVIYLGIRHFLIIALRLKIVIYLGIFKQGYSKLFFRKIMYAYLYWLGNLVHEPKSQILKDLIKVLIWAIIISSFLLFLKTIMGIGNVYFAFPEAVVTCLLIFSLIVILLLGFDDVFLLKFQIIKRLISLTPQRPSNNTVESNSLFFTKLEMASIWIRVFILDGLITIIFSMVSLIV